MTDIVDLKKARQERSNNAKDWDVVDALRATIEKIESGEWKNPDLIYIALSVEGSTPGAKHMAHTCAGGNGWEIKGLLAQHLYMQCDPRAS